VKVRYRYRLAPTEAQREHLTHVFGSCRYVFNHMLRVRTDAYFKDGVSVGYHESSRRLTALKQTPEHAWLNDVSCVPTQQSLRHLQVAFINFFEKRTAYPTFKRKDGKQSAEYTRSAFKWTNSVLSVSGLGTLKVRWSRAFTSIPSTVTISLDTAGRYFVSLCLDEPREPLPKTGQSVGIDLGITRLATLSNGERIENPRPLKRLEALLTRASRDLSRKSRGSRRRADAKLRLAKLHARVSDARADYLNKVTTDLVRRFDVICIEDLHVRGMTKNHSLARALSDAALGSFRRMIEYKAAWHGREVRVVDRFYPSSKRCSACGHVVKELPLSIRTWTCPDCRAVHDRDENAAINILAAGQAVRGGKIRPMWVRTRKGTSRRNANHLGESLHTLLPRESPSL
jgi:putative transposase